MDQTIRYRPRTRQLPWLILVAPAGLLAGALADDTPRAVTFAGALVVLMSVELRWLSRTGVTLRPDALFLHGIRTRVLPWAAIDWIAPERELGAWILRVRCAGRLYRLRAPYHQAFLAPDPEFTAKARVLYDYWLAHRGATWQPPPDPWLRAPAPPPADPWLPPAT